jgi:REP element-mobilizing transposase RayT
MADQSETTPQFPQSSPEPEQPTLPLPEIVPWYEDQSQVEARLSHIELGPGLHEGVITHAGELWATAGKLSPDTAKEIASTTFRFWENGENADLARFVYLKTNDSQYFLYASRLSAKLVLTLVFDANMPFSLIRPQALRLARSLLTPSASIPGTVTGPHLSGQPSVQVEEQSPTIRVAGLSLPPRSELIPLPGEVFAADQIGENTSSSAWVRDYNATSTGPSQVIDPERRDINISNLEQPSGTEPRADMKQDYHIPAQPEKKFESLVNEVSNLIYTALLLPRIPHHSLTGDLASRINRWMPQVCLAFGWKLEGLIVSPDYMEWMVHLPPNVTPVKMLEVVRTQTSQHIFITFSYLTQENPSGDFWAPGYLIASGAGALPVEILHDYIMRVRSQQTIAEF